ncbi:hypothetical protein [Acinetobacter sp.]|uniref:hypothetical protein n=1 Tax=Acinetobacter sp. TaxID=472 RepID=UPI0035B40D59
MTKQPAQSLNQQNPSKAAEQLQQAVHGYTQDQAAYLKAFDDLNGDGVDDAVVLLQGQNWCGSGGCTMLIFRGLDQQKFQLVNKVTVADAPIYALSKTSQGWKNLAVYSKGKGTVVLKFNGQAYPANPSLLPKETAKSAPDSFKLLIGQD